MRLRALAVLICCASLLAVPAAAAGRGAPIPTTISRDFATTIGTVLQQYGHLTSPNPKCLAGRTVKLVYYYPDGEKLVDTDVTSFSGIWGGSGPSGITGLRYTATTKRFGPKKHRRTCASATGQVTD